MFVKYSVFITCMYYYLLRDMPIVMCIYLIQIDTFLLFHVLKREVSNVFLYIWTINYSYSYSFACDIVKAVCVLHNMILNKEEERIPPTSSDDLVNEATINTIDLPAYTRLKVTQRSHGYQR